jgi:small subunit ribosomal protein S1
MTHPNSLDTPSEVQASEQTPESTAEATETSFGEILNQFEQQQHRQAETIEGRVITITDDSIIIDIGRKTEGRLSLEKARSGGISDLKPGDTLPVSVSGHDEEGYYALSTVRVERPKDWSSLQRAFAEKATVAGTVKELVKGGLRVDVGVRAFMPASRSGAKDVPEMESLIGQEIQCRITKLDVEKEDVVVDRRVVLEEEVAKAREHAFSQLHEGQVVQGNVRTITEFGAFLDIGGFDGLLHVADMSWSRAVKPGDVVHVGDQFDVKILKINRDTKKISLGLKQLLPDPWSLASEKYQVGQRVQGIVARVTDFGAFVELEPGLDGLIHLSEMSWSKKVRKPSDVVKPGDMVEAVVLKVDPSEKRIALGLKQALGDPWDQISTQHPVGSVVEAPVVSLAKFGAFVDLGNGIEGMIHIGDISRDKRLNHPNEVLKEGQTVRTQVLEIDKDKRRLRLGMKQLEPTSADTYIAEHQVGENVTGRVVDVSANRARVELAEGVHASCRLGQEGGRPAARGNEDAAKPDVSALTAMLAARWKSGGPSGPEGPKPGQIRSFRIVLLDPVQKRIDVELAG